MAIPPPLQRSKAACGRDSDSNADGLADVSRYRHCFTEKKRPKLRCTSPLLFVPERYCCTNIRILASLVSRASSSAMNDEAMQSSSTSDVQVQVAVDPSRKRGVWRLKTQLHQRVKAVPKPVFLGGFVVAVTLMSVAAMARHHLNRLSVALAVPCVSPPPAPSPNATTGLSDEDSSGSSWHAQADKVAKARRPKPSLKRRMRRMRRHEFAPPNLKRSTRSSKRRTNGLCRETRRSLRH